MRLKELRVYGNKKGKEPFTKWISTLKDVVARANIKNRIRRLALGNYGDCKFVSCNIHELRIHFGPGYRVYFAEIDNSIIVLLNGGSKRTQERDIIKAKRYWENFLERYYEQE